MRPEAAQARGRALLNLRLRDAEGGLLGRTLLSLVSNKVAICAYAVIKGRHTQVGQVSDVLVMQGGGSVSVPLPAHKVSPHDVVELRPSKGDASLPAVANGIVHRHASSAGCPA